MTVLLADTDTSVTAAGSRVNPVGAPDHVPGSPDRSVAPGTLNAAPWFTRRGDPDPAGGSKAGESRGHNVG